jgi:response regulator RpfG family c-di-GMP phosphodiesterase
MLHKNDVLVIEPVLEDRKTISRLLSSNLFSIYFLDKVEEASIFFDKLIPHIIIANIDLNPKESAEQLVSLLDFLPDEISIFAMSKKPDSSICRKLLDKGIRQVFPKPLQGMITSVAIKEAVDLQGPIVMKIKSHPTKINIQSTILAFGESDVLVRTNLIPSALKNIHAEGKLFDSIFRNPKVFLMTENKLLNFSEDYLTLTMLGLTNEDLKAIRAKVLHWEILE